VIARIQSSAITVSTYKLLRCYWTIEKINSTFYYSRIWCWWTFSCCFI